MNSFYPGKQILVTGGAGFIGTNLVLALREAGARVRTVSRGSRPQVDVDEHLNLNLRDRADCRRAVEGQQLVFHVAAHGWGLGRNVGIQTELLTANVQMNTNLLEAAHEAGVDRYLYTSSVGVYGADQTAPDDRRPWDGDPDPSLHCFGWAKRIAEIQCRAYADYAKMKIAIVRPSNPYGPWDIFDAAKSHVIPALILKALDKSKPFEVWGTGRATRSFVYVGDLVRGMMDAMERYATAKPLNLAGDAQTSIAELARTILDFVGREKEEIVFDPNKPEGTPGKVYSIAHAREAIGFTPAVSLRDGLRQTIDWYLDRSSRPGGTIRE